MLSLGKHFLPFCLLLVIATCSFHPNPLPFASPAILEQGWKKVGRASSDDMHKMLLGLTPRLSAEDLHSMVIEVSDISSSKYGQYFTLDELTSVMAPPKKDREQIRIWAEKNGLHVTFSKSLDFATLTAPVYAIEKAFNVECHEFEHVHSGRRLVRTTDHVYLDSQIHPLIDVVVGLTDFLDSVNERAGVVRAITPTSTPDIRAVRGSERDAIVVIELYCFNGQKAGNDMCGEYSDPQPSKIVVETTPDNGEQSMFYRADVKDVCSGGICKVHIIVQPWVRVTFAATTYFGNERSEAGIYTSYAPSPWVTPQYISEMYNIPQGLRGSHPNNSQSVTAFEKQYISLSDLKSFFDVMGLPYQNPIIHGPNDPAHPGGESTLDIQYIMGTGKGIKTTFWSVGGPGPTHGNGAYILAWAKEIASTPNPPLVTSISYGDTEQGFFQKFGSYDYINRMNIELAKMSVRGLTVVAGSGDAGASNVGEAGNDISNTDPTCTPMRPFFPSNSPYVVSVSSTFPSKRSLPLCNEKFSDTIILCDRVGEVAVNVNDGIFWTTGGGFSMITPQLEWQADAVNDYLRKSDLSFPPNEYWNNGGRGYPDLSTLGHNLVVILGGKKTPIGGTSASGPVLAGIFSLLNDIRLKAKLPTIGLVTPLLYNVASPNSKYYDAYFNDVVVGSNFDGDIQAKDSPYPTRCPYGFQCSAGWDAVTGLGTPNFSSLAKLMKVDFSAKNKEDL